MERLPTALDRAPEQDEAVVDAGSEEELRARFAEDPWALNGMLTVTSVERWTILLSPEE